MQSQAGIWASPAAFLTRNTPDHPILFLCPNILQATARRFQAGFDGLVTYAVKANPHVAVLDNLVAAGLSAFDVASPAEMKAVRSAAPMSALHYNNPVRSDAEIAAGIAAGVTSWSVDDPAGLAQLNPVPRNCEVAVRFKLPVAGAAYDFGRKFGATPETAATLLARVAAMGFTPSLTFHPGTQCTRPEAWAIYIREAARIAGSAGVRIARLNVGGGFPVSRGESPVSPCPALTTINTTAHTAFGTARPGLVCEPGRAMVGDSGCLGLRIKSVREDGAVFLNDGIYGGLADLTEAGPTSRIVVHAADGSRRHGPERPVAMFGPTCDSLDRLPDGMALPADTQAGDYALFCGLGAYSLSMATGFNGYGVKDVITVLGLSGH